MRSALFMDKVVWIGFYHRLLFLGGLWLVLAGTGVKAISVGLFAVPAAIWLSLLLLPPKRHLILRRSVVHFPVFVKGSLLGGLDVARRAFSSRLPVSPGWVEVPLQLPDGGRVAVGAELSLMPGTLAAGARRQRLLVHLLDTEAGFEHAIPREEAAIASMILDRNEGSAP